MQFKKYRKVTPTQARILTGEDFSARGGVIQTLEGPKSFEVGDYLARDAKGEWPIKKERIEKDYRRLTEPHADDGFAFYQSLEVREARKMIGWFTIGELTGKAGDYLVRSGQNEWSVDRELFESTYMLVEGE